MSFYTLQLGEKPAEFLNFVTRMRASYPDKFDQLQNFIKKIGDHYGATHQHFKHERNAHALPANYFRFKENGVEASSRFGLRLYCTVLSTQVVVLYNGDLKTQHFPEDCANVRQHFLFAINATSKIDKAIHQGSVAVDGTDLLVEEGYELDL